MDDAQWLSEYRGLVVRIATQLAQQYRLRRFMDDLLAFGTEGLLDARRRFEDGRGSSFATYAWYRIRGTILDGCRSMGLVARRRRKRLEAQSAVNEHQLVRFEDNPEAPASPEQAARDLDAMVSDAAAIFLLKDPDRHELTVPDPGPNPEEIASRSSTRSWVRTELDKLPERDRDILVMSFFEGKTLEEIATLNGYSRSWACRTRSSALKKLRRRLVQEKGFP